MVRAYFPQRVPKSIVSNSNNPPQGMEITGVVPSGANMLYETTGAMLYETGGSMEYET